MISLIIFGIWFVGFTATLVVFALAGTIRNTPDGADLFLAVIWPATWVLLAALTLVQWAVDFRKRKESAPKKDVA